MMAQEKTWRTFVALFGLSSGILCALLGSLLIGISWLIAEPHYKHLLHTVGNNALYLTVPLLLLGAFYADALSSTKARTALAEDE